jgi:hypothetical protein
MTIEGGYIVPKLVVDFQDFFFGEDAIEPIVDYEIDITSRIFLQKRGCLVQLLVPIREGCRIRSYSYETYSCDPERWIIEQNLLPG